jgi:hypothetical protein
MTKRVLYPGLVGVGIAVFLAASLARLSAGQVANGPVSIDADDIGGVVTSTKGPEAGVWVIAETTGLPTKYSKTVVTDDRGRYLVPDLPKATYTVWVRGYGLVDSPKVESAPGKLLNLTAVVAPNPLAAAQLYPAAYWHALLQVPAPSEFPGTGVKGNGISENVKSQADWVSRIKTGGCQACHQLGNKATRELSPKLGTFKSSADAWEHRVQVGQAGPNMLNQINNMGRRALTQWGDWTDRIKAGEVPPAPPRPQGLERNVVLTQWDYGDAKKYTHDANSTDKRNPTVNANGPIYIDPEVSTDALYVVDPVKHAAYAVEVPVRDATATLLAPTTMPKPSPFWGSEPIWTGKTTPHSSMMDGQGRVWTASRIRGEDNPAWCKAGSSHPSAKNYPITKNGRQLTVYDQKTRQWTMIDTCFGTHHLMFDEKDVLWFTNQGATGDGDVLGWFDTKMFASTKDEQKSQGWAPFVRDSNGNGKRDMWVEPGQPPDPAKDQRISSPLYSVIQNPVDGSMWGSVTGFPGHIYRFNPATSLTEIYEPPFDRKTMTGQGFTVRTLDIDRKGVLWITLTGSSHLASFDRTKCKGPLNGPNASGQHCPEGWTLYPLPGPKFKGDTVSVSTEATYINWVDQFDTLGLGKDTPITVGNSSDSLHALVNGKFVTLRVPYPMGFYAKGVDGRIDDPKAGWKGKGLWSGSGTRAPFHQEGGAGTKPKLVHFQLRPDPLAK